MARVLRETFALAAVIAFVWMMCAVAVGLEPFALAVRP